MGTTPRPVPCQDLSPRKLEKMLTLLGATNVLKKNTPCRSLCLSYRQHTGTAEQSGALEVR